MIYEKSTKVYCCCGQYIVPDKAVADRSIICPRCGQKLDKPLKVPSVVRVKK